MTQDIVYSLTRQGVADDKIVLILVSYVIGHLARDVEGTSKFEDREQYLHTREVFIRK
jgi:hypothetical protein